jgi:hypothetical protein
MLESYIDGRSAVGVCVAEDVWIIVVGCFLPFEDDREGSWFAASSSRLLIVFKPNDSEVRHVADV